MKSYSGREDKSVDQEPKVEEVVVVPEGTKEEILEVQTSEVTLSKDVDQIGPIETSTVSSRITEPDSIRREISQLMDDMTDGEIRLASAQSEGATRTDGAKAIGKSINTVKKWDLSKVDRMVTLMVQHRIETALIQRERLLSRAVAVKAKGLEDPDPKIRQRVATEIIDWNLGRAGQTKSIQHSGTVKVEGLHKAMVKIYGEKT